MELSLPEPWIYPYALPEAVDITSLEAVGLSLPEAEGSLPDAMELFSSEAMDMALLPVRGGGYDFACGGRYDN